MKKVSIVVVIYNIEPYLEACLDSICAQTYSNLEVILSVGEGTDCCEQICECYASKDSRFVVVKHKPEGVAKARNKGLEKVTGDYLAWIDGDDRVEPEYIERLVKALEETEADIAICAHDEVGENTTKTVISTMSEGLHTRREVLERMLAFDGIGHYLWDKLFRMSAVNGIKIPDLKSAEDRPWITEVMKNCNRYAYTKYVGYHYTIREQSESKQDYNAPLSLLADKEMEGWLREAEPSLKDLTDYYMFFSYYRVLYQDILRDLKEYNSTAFIKEMRAYIPGAKRACKVSCRDRLKMSFVYLGRPYLIWFVKMTQRVRR